MIGNRRRLEANCHLLATDTENCRDVRLGAKFGQMLQCQWWILEGMKCFNATAVSCKVKVKVKVTLVQALRLCTGRTAHRGSRGIALPFLDHGTRRGWGVSVTGRQHCGCIIPQAVTHSLVLLKMGKIFARNMLSWLGLLISRYCCI